MEAAGPAEGKEVSEQTTETAPPDTAEWRQKIEDKIDRLAEMLKGGGKEQGSEAEPSEPASMSAEVRRELEKLRAEEERTRKDAERDAEVGELKAKVNAERPPREYRRATRVMRWDTEADR